jgi:hypothetical protein
MSAVAVRLAEGQLLRAVKKLSKVFNISRPNTMTDNIKQ